MPEQRPTDVLGEQMALAKLARASADWTEYERARERALRLALSHRVEDEVARYRQVMSACTGWQDTGADARELMMKRLRECFVDGVERGSSARDVIIRMQRIPRAAASAAFVREMRRGDGEVCVAFVLAHDGRMPEDVRARVGDDPERIARRLGERDWAGFVAPLLALAPGELRQDLLAAAHVALERALAAVAG